MALPPTPLTDLLYGVRSDDVPGALEARGWLSADGGANRQTIVEMACTAQADVERQGDMPGESPADLLADRLVRSGFLNDVGVAAHDLA